jgi:hypothetical protein
VRDFSAIFKSNNASFVLIAWAQHDEKTERVTNTLCAHADVSFKMLVLS